MPEERKGLLQNEKIFTLGLYFAARMCYNILIRVWATRLLTRIVTDKKNRLTLLYIERKKTWQKKKRGAPRAALVMAVPALPRAVPEEIRALGAWGAAH